MITSFIIHHLGWQAGNKFGSFAPDSDYPLTGLLPRNPPSGISGAFSSLTRKLGLARLSVLIRRTNRFPVARLNEALRRSRQSFRSLVYRYEAVSCRSCFSIDGLLDSSFLEAYRLTFVFSPI